MTVHTTHPQPSTLARALELLASVGMAFMALGVVATLAGYNGFGLTNSQLADQEVMSLPVELNIPVDFDDNLNWVDTTNGTVDEATGKPPVSLSGPVTAQLGFWGPTTGERIVFVLWSIAGPLLGMAGLWQVLGMARSTRIGDPFTQANESRLWRLALIIAVGGFAYVNIGYAIQTWLVERSAAADLVDMTFTISFLPIIIGVAVAALASIWRVGVGLREDVDGTI